jgi:hypothetical protein
MNAGFDEKGRFPKRVRTENVFLQQKEIDRQDERIRRLFARTEIRAGENLKYRIMQQIGTESALAGTKMKTKNALPQISSLFSVLGVMYALIAIVAAGVFMMGGQQALQSSTFLIPVGMIAFVCGLFLVISVYDDRRRARRAGY